jgi:hypothetical protein
MGGPQIQKTWLTLLAGALALAMAAPAAATPGNPDVDFGGTGTVTLKPAPATITSLDAVGIDDADNVVVVGAAESQCCNDETFVDALEPNGNSVPNSSVEYSFSDHAHALVVLGDGEYVLGGEHDPGDFELLRLKAGGIATQGDFPLGDAASVPTGAQDVVVQADGNPVGAGTAFLGSAPAIGLLRVSAQNYAAPDDSFGGDA